MARAGWPSPDRRSGHPPATGRLLPGRGPFDEAVVKGLREVDIGSFELIIEGKQHSYVFDYEILKS